jgi:hypothetical protein
MATNNPDHIICTTSHSGVWNRFEKSAAPVLERLFIVCFCQHREEALRDTPIHGSNDGTMKRITDAIGRTMKMLSL